MKYVWKDIQEGSFNILKIVEIHVNDCCYCYIIIVVVIIIIITVVVVVIIKLY